MGKLRPKKPETPESAKVEAKIGLAEQNFRKEAYEPKLIQYRDMAEKEDLVSVGEGVASADVAAAAGRPVLAATQSVDRAADLASAGASQMLEGQVKGKVGEMSDKVTVLKLAQQDADTAASGLSTATKLAESEALTNLKNESIKSAGAIKAAGQLASFFQGNLDQFNKTRGLSGFDQDQKIGSAIIKGPRLSDT